MEKMFGLVLSCALMAFSCSSTGAAGGGAPHQNHAVPVAKSPADACLHVHELVAKADPKALPWSPSDNSNCASFLKLQVGLWEPKVGEAVVQCILESTDPNAALGKCRSGVVAKSLGLGLLKSDLSIADACLSLRDQQARAEPGESFDGPDCERELEKELERWQPAVVQAFLRCTVGAPNYRLAESCSLLWIPEDLGVEHPDKSKVNEAYANMSLMIDRIVAYYAANAKLPPAIASTPSKDCCSQGGQCQPNASDWDIPGWKALSFKIETPHYYHYRIEMAESRDGAEAFNIIAAGDLDCDGNYAKFTRYGEVRDGKIESMPDVLVRGGRYE